MRILQLASGEYFDLNSGSNIEFTRYNPFFNELTELSQPMDLPLSRRNKRLLGFPNRPDRSLRMEQHDVVLDHGFVQMPARMVIHSTDGKSVSATFYPNDGGFYARIKDKTLQDVFASEILSFADVGKAVEFCESLIKRPNTLSSDEKMSIFAVKVDGMEEDTFRVLNELQEGSSSKFAGRNPRKLKIGDKLVHFPAGYGITPFVRIRWAMRRMLRYFGYELSGSFLDSEPMVDAVMVNNNLDSLLDGKIHIAKLLPEISVSTFIHAFRSRFCCELEIDEMNKSAELVFFRDLETAASIDLTDKMAGEPEISFPEFERITLRSEFVDDGAVYLNAQEVMKNHPETARLYRRSDVLTTTHYTPTCNIPWFYHPMNGYIYRMSVKADRFTAVPQANLGGDFISEGTEGVKEIVIEGKQPVLDTYVEPGSPSDKMTMYIGGARNVKSVIVYSDQDEASAEENELPVMIAFAGLFNNGAITDMYDWAYGDVPLSLLPNGEKGLFNQFYRWNDYLRRNALAKITVTMKLTEPEKINLRSCARIYLSGRNYLLDSMRYRIGEGMVEMSLYGIDPYDDPVETEQGAFGELPSYQWVISRTYDIPGHDVANLTFSEWSTDPDTIYLDTATEADYRDYPTGGSALAYERTYAGVWYRTIGGPTSGLINGKATIGFKVKKV